MRWSHSVLGELEHSVGCLTTSNATCKTYASLVRKCGDAQALDLGRRVHAHIDRSAHSSDRFLRNLLVGMYGKCGRLEEAASVFHLLREPNIFSWTLITAAYAQNGHYHGALTFFRRMNLEGVKPDKVVFITVLDACAALLDSRQGKLVHELVLDCGLESELVVSNTLINMYGKCRSLERAVNLFDRMELKDAVSWNALIAAFVQNRQHTEGLLLFRDMELEGVKPTNFTLTALLEACATVEAGRSLHARICTSGFDSEVVVLNTLITMYARCKSIDDSRLVFDNIRNKSVVSWNSMITAYAQSRAAWEAIELFKRMDIEGFQANEVTFINVVEACAKVEDASTGRRVHELAQRAGFVSDHVLGNSLVNMYGKCGDLEAARELFDRLDPFRSSISWSTIISVFAQNERGKDVLVLFRQMELEGIKANPVTFVSVLDACATLQALAQGKTFHERVVLSGFDSHLVLRTTLVNMYAKCQCLDAARELLEVLQINDVVSWNAVISASSQQEQGLGAMALLHRMDQEGVKVDRVTLVAALDACCSLKDLKLGRNVHARARATGHDLETVVANTLINMYAKCGSLEEAASVFEAAQHRDVVTYNVMLSAYAQQGQVAEALSFFRQLQQQGFRMEQASLVSILDVCGNTTGELSKGRDIHLSVSTSSSSLLCSEMVKNALVDMYARSGSVKEARDVFDTIQKPSLISWTAMLAGYARHGHARDSLELFRDMQQDGGAFPDVVTFLAVIFACSHAGWLREAFRLFASMTGDYCLQPQLEDYGCIVDMLGRMGKLQEAEGLVDTMPFEPNALAYTALLGACQLHGNLELGSRAAAAAAAAWEADFREVESSSYVLLSNIYIRRASEVLEAS